MFLSEHPEKNNLTKVIHELAKENKITITPIQIKKEAALFGASYQTLIKTIE
jgi:FKBP-type peptidyl-prolyl cis-trans isomerase (trigger factor)